MNFEDGAKNVKSLTRSFRFALRGVAYCVRNERNMRIHLTAAVYVFIFSFFYGFSAAEYSVLFLCFGMVLSAEAVNTAIEVLINLERQSYDNIARIAKDIAAGAVFLSAVFAAVVGCILFLKPEKIQFIAWFLSERPLLMVCLLISLPVAAAFVFYYPFRIRSRIGRLTGRK